MTQETYFGNMHRNIMGTTSFDLRIKGMRKNQDFIVYPIHAGNQHQVITVQSSTRIGKIDLSTGKGKMSASHANGAYNVHLQMDTLVDFDLRNVDLEALKLFMFTTQGEKVGTRGIVTDNSGASLVIGGAL